MNTYIAATVLTVLGSLALVQDASAQQACSTRFPGPIVFDSPFFWDLPGDLGAAQISAVALGPLDGCLIGAALPLSNPPLLVTFNGQIGGFFRTSPTIHDVRDTGIRIPSDCVLPCMLNGNAPYLAPMLQNGPLFRQENRVTLRIDD